MKKFIGDGINSEIKNSTCNNVLNVIRALVEDETCKVYIPNDYKNGTLYRADKDPRVHFYPTDCGKKIQVVGLQSNQERYNFSVMALVDVLVETPTADGSVDMQDRQVWRQFNIIRDGKLCMDYVCADLSEENFDALKKIGILYYNGVKVEMNHKHKPGYVYKIMLKDLPLISYNWANPVTIGLYEYMKREAELVAVIKYLKEYKKEHEATMPRKPFYEPTTGVYVENYTGSFKASDRELERVECIVYSIKNLPAVSLEISTNYETLDDLNEDISKLNTELRYVRFIIRCVVYAIESTEKKGSYNWSEAVKSPRSEKYTWEADVNVGDEQFTLVKQVYYKNV